jgi:hypothetical protein
MQGLQHHSMLHHAERISMLLLNVHSMLSPQYAFVISTHILKYILVQAGCLEG